MWGPFAELLERLAGGTAVGGTELSADVSPVHVNAVS
jgi:hypothetical protein